MTTLTIEYPPEVLDALNQDSSEFEAQARLLLALKLYENGKLSTGLAAKLAGMRARCFCLSWASTGSPRFVAA